MVPGEIFPSDEPVIVNEHKQPVAVDVTNTGDRPIQVGSHYHFAETNPALAFDRAAADGCHLDIPAGTSVRFEPGISRSVTLVPFGGARIMRGFRTVG